MVAPPSHAELYAHLNAHLAEQMQSRRTSGVNAPVRSLPSGLEPLEHFSEAFKATSPLEAEPQIADDLNFAIKMHLDNCDGDINAWREIQFNNFSSAVRSLEDIEPIFNAQRPKSSVLCLAHVSVLANALAAFPMDGQTASPSSLLWALNPGPSAFFWNLLEEVYGSFL